MLQEIYNNITSEIDRNSADLWELSLTIFNHPETAFKEHNACTILSEKLRFSGFSIETGLGGLETAFRASIGKIDGPTVAILAEYDALVGLGHACGHNLIAVSAIGAGIALGPVINRLDGQIQIIGTPAEEGGGGKIILAEAGVFDSVDAAMMFHPADKNMVLRQSLASTKLKIEFFGKSSHAAAAPDEGINALDALILTFNNINALRLTFSTYDRVSGIILDGGKAANIIPEHSAADFSIRSLSVNRRDKLVGRVIDCAQGAAMATGCHFKYEKSPGYKNIIPNKVLGNLFAMHLSTLGREIAELDPYEQMGSTDMGDISHIIPAIHPYLAIAPEKTPGHTLEFKEYAHSETGKSAMLDASKALALTAADLLLNTQLLSDAKNELLSIHNSK